ncbi:MAG: hypothetical protein AAGC60_00190 [Acidobacteriota bacterium]
MRTHTTRLIVLIALLLFMSPSAFADDAQTVEDVVMDVLCEIYEVVTGGECNTESIDGDDDPADPEIGPALVPGG